MERERDGEDGDSDISRFFPRIDRIVSGEALNPFSAQDEGFSEFSCILVFDTERIY